ncbi:MAG: ATPase, partial [Desulfurococcaceae archaeon]
MKIAGETIYIPDLASLIEGAVSKLIEEGVISGRIIIHKAIIQLLEFLASKGRGIAHAGLEELGRLRKLHEDARITLEYMGEKIRLHGDEVDEVIISEVNSAVRDLAMSIGGVIITGDVVEYNISKALGLQVYLVEKREKNMLLFETFFDENTMSVHLKEGTRPIAKKGKPGNWRYVKLDDKPLT